MSDPDTLAKYSFLPWLRQGLANNIKAIPLANLQRATIAIDVDVVTDTGLRGTAKSTIELIGPGDIIGISPHAIVRRDPRDWITDYEPNYLAHIEFYDEDFPWRYTPMPADAAELRLTPWITLVVLKEGEFEDSQDVSGPLQFFDTTGIAADVFPPISQLWAWAHVHVNADLTVDGNGQELGTEQSVNLLENLLTQNPDTGYSRILCPRQLDPNQGYHAFLIPTFETGRLAGLGEKIDPAVGALDIGWDTGPKPYQKLLPTRFPYYSRWYFRTGAKGDFEYLVRLLKPRTVDKKVGIRDMDVSDPGKGVDGIDMGPGQPQVLGLEGALRSPDTKSTDWPQQYPEKFQGQLAGFINKADDYQQANPDTDPVITPPLYARWHALRQRLSLEPDEGKNPYDPQAKWLTELNLDPRHRAAAGLGTRVVQENQEEFMNKAWGQIGEVLEANQRLKRAQLAEAASIKLFAKHFQPLHDNLKFSWTAPVHKRVLGSEQTVYQKTKLSSLPAVTVSPEFRKILRPRGPVSRRSLPEVKRRPPTNLLSRINEGEIFATPPKLAPTGNFSLDKAAAHLAPPGVPGWLQDFLRQSWFRWLPLILALLAFSWLILLGASAAGWVILGLGGAGLVGLQRYFSRWAQAVKNRDAVREENLTPKAMDELPKSPNFRITAPGDSAAFATGHTDSLEAQRFKTALKDLTAVFVNRPEVPAAGPPLDIPGLTKSIMAAIDPKVAIPQRVLSSLILPVLIRLRMPDRIVPVMAYPEFPQPMYEPLRDISTDFLIPNINLVPQNTISLLVTNQKFIESYMVGLNYEMGRELLWREYPTDQRPSCFRQFWNVADFVNKAPSLTHRQLAEKLKDIPEIHKWLSTTALGTHNQRESGGDISQLVLIVRGDLLKRYPNTVIYALRAQWDQAEDGTVLKDKPRRFAPTGTKAERIANEKYPLYSAHIEPDIFFLGFDLTVEEARGTDQDPGWFFVLKERVGEPRYGLDLEDEAVAVPLKEWDDLSWGDVKEDLAAGNYLRLPDDKNKIKPDNPAGVEWYAQSNAADVAYILYQDPVLVAVHAQEMLTH